MKTRILTLIMSLFVTMMAFAYDAKISGIYYNFDETNKTAEVTYHSSDYNSYSGDIVIPASVSYDGIAYNVTSIGDYAFSDCSYLTSITIPNSVTSIGNSAFSSCSSLTSISIGNSVTSIGDYAFSDCSRLTSITIPNSVTSIGNNAFSGCSSLTSITIPNSVTSIGNYAFNGCRSLTSITIPNSVTSIGSSAFSGCSNIAEIHISDIAKWCDIDFKGSASNPLYNKNACLYVSGNKITELVIPEGVDSIKNYAFYNYAQLTSITIPNSVTSIGEWAFYYCSSLTSITIPNSVTSIGNYAFSGCTSLTSITIPNSVTSIGGRAFSSCSSLISITIPNSVTSIGDEAFLYCSRLTSITIPNSVTSIGNSAFYACSSLTSIEIPNSVTSIGDDAFYWCSSLTSIEIPNSVTSIGDYAFSRCSSLTSIEIPNSVTSIGSYAFYYCSSLTSVTIGNSVTSIGDYAFSRCYFLISIEIPNSVTSIGEYAFYYCESLTSITIPNSVTSIGEYAFHLCSSLTSIEIPNSVTSIGRAAFMDCNGLKAVYISDLAAWCNIDFAGYSSNPLYYAENLYLNNKRITQLEIPEGVTKIKSFAFYNCDFLTHITIPSTLTHIDACAIADCDSLFVIYMKPKERPYFSESINCGSNILDKNPNLKQIIVPCGSGYSYYSDIYNEVKEINTNISNLLIIKDKNSFATYKGIYDYSFNEQQFTKNGTLNLGGINWTLKTDAGYFGFDGNNTNSLERGQQIGSTKKPASYITLKTEDITDKITKIKVNTSGASSINATFNVLVNGTRYTPSIVNLTNAATEYEFTGAESGEITLKWTNNSSKAIYIKSIYIETEKEMYLCDYNGCSNYGYIEIMNTNCDEGTIEIKAIPYEGHTFIQWSDGNTENPRTISAHELLVAEFSMSEKYTVSLSCDTNKGTVTGSGEYDENANVTIEAIANEGYHFVKWSDGNTENPRTIVVTEDVELMAEFAINQYEVNVMAGENGYVTGSGTYNYGTEVTIEAIANEGYHFVEWSDGNTENPRTIVVTEDVELMAEFAINQYEVNVMAGENGYVTGSGTYNYGTEVTIEAIANEGYHFVQWSDGNTENPRTIVVTEDVELKAEFAINQYEVNVTAGENGYATGSGTYDYGTEVTIEALANDGYHFVQWSDGNTENPRTIVVTEDVELMAKFEEDDKTMDDNVDESSVIVYVQDGVIYIEGAETDYHVLDAAGRLIYSGRDAQLSLPRGVYAIAVGGEVEKVVI